MFGFVVLASAALAQTAPISVEATRADWVDVGYEELRAGQPQAAIQRIRANRELDANDPAALLNLGAAHARLGQTEMARSYYRAAAANAESYDVQLSDGRWVDTRRAARIALAAQLRSTSLAAR